MFELAGLATGLIGGIGKMISRGKANKEMGRLMKEDPTYAANPLAAQRLGLAQTLLNARMPGASAAERNIYTNQANQLASVDRNATDASQALAIKSGVGAGTNNSFQDLGQMEASDYQRRFGNLVNAQEGVINEGNKVFQDQTRRFDNKVQFKGAQAANRAANWSDVSNIGFGLMDFGAAGGFSNLFGGNGGGQGSPTNPSQGVSTNWLMQNRPMRRP